MISRRVRNLLTGILLGLFALVVLYVLAKSIPYAYASLGIAAFVVGGGTVWFLVKGWKRTALVVAVGVFSVGLVIALRATTRQVLTIVNESDQTIRDLSIFLPASNHSLEADRIPPHSVLTICFHSITYSRAVVVMGHFADGTEIPSKDQNGLPVRGTMPLFDSRQKRVVIQTGGTVRVLPQ